MTVLGYSTGRIQKKDDDVMEILNRIKEEYPSGDIDTGEVIRKFKDPIDESIDKGEAIDESELKCEFQTMMAGSKCELCGSPKWHVDKFGYLCKEKLYRYGIEDR